MNHGKIENHENPSEKVSYLCKEEHCIVFAKENKHVHTKAEGIVHCKKRDVRQDLFSFIVKQATE